MAGIQVLLQCTQNVQGFADHTGTTLLRLHAEMEDAKKTADLVRLQHALSDAAIELADLASAAGNLRIRLLEYLDAVNTPDERGLA
jgi:hypothetical protein